MYKELLEKLFKQELKPNEKSEARVKCPFHDDEHASASVNVNTGLFHCFACGASYNIVQLLQQLSPENFPTINSAKTFIIKKFGSNPELQEKIKEVMDSNYYLLSKRTLLSTFIQQRALSEDIVKKYSLGYSKDKDYFVIPVFDDAGILRTIKYYNHSKTPKLYFDKSPVLNNKNYIYPIKNLLNNSEIFLTEGELDALSLENLGYKAVSFTAGSSSIPDDSIIEYFRNKNVIIFYDNDKPGKLGAIKVAEKLKDYVASLKIWDWSLVPEASEHDDITDIILKALVNSESISKILAQIPFYVHNIQKINFNDIYNIKNFGKEFYLESLIVGKSITPYTFYRNIEAICDKPNKNLDKCKNCPLKVSKLKKHFDYDDIFKFIDNKTTVIESYLRSIMGIPKCPNAKFLYNDGVFITRVIGAEAPDFRDFQLSKTANTSKEFYVISDKEFDINTSYTFKGKIIPDDRNQRNRIVLVDPIESSPDFLDYQFNDESWERLEIFKTKNDNEDEILEKLDMIAEVLSEVTRIFGRKNMILFYYLIWKSILSFYCFDEYIERGWLQGLLIGDQRTGKSKAGRMLIDYFGLGDFISAESASVVGLIGGLAQIDKTWILKWGKLPQNDRRLLIIDEASELSPEAIGKLSEVRSEGIAQITKIEKEVAPARTRLIMISNPRYGHPMDSYLYPIEVIKEVIRKPEDIARFDLAYAVFANDVSQDIINSLHKEKIDLVSKFKKPFTESVIWSWSRTPKQVFFTKKAEYKILDWAKKLGEFYDPYYVPLIQSSNIRIKLARISASVASAVMSTDKTWTKLIVKPSHVNVAVKLLEDFSKKIGYYSYSKFTKNKIDKIMQNKDDIIEMFKKNSLASRYIYESSSFYFRELTNNLGYDELEVAEFKRTLMKYNLVTRNSNGSFSKTRILMKLLSEALGGDNL